MRTAEIDPDEIGVIASNAGEVIDVCNRICELNKQIADNAAERIRIKTALAQLEPWKNLDIPLNAKDTKTTAVFIGSIQKGVQRGIAFRGTCRGFSEA